MAADLGSCWAFATPPRSTSGNIVVVRNRYRFDRAFIANNPPSLPLIQLERFAVLGEHQHSCVSIFRASMGRRRIYLPPYFASGISTLPMRLMASASILASLSQNF